MQSVAFAQTMLDKEQSAAAKVKALREAVEAHKNYAKDVSYFGLVIQFTCD